MRIEPSDVVHLLHSRPWCVLATHATQLAGYPFASVLPFVPDAAHCPVFLISGLAEHTHNLVADARASVLVQAEGESVLQGERVTLLGDARPFAADDAFTRRFLRYQPEAEQYLALGDFAFYRFVPQRVRYVGGFARMGWLAQEEWAALPNLSAEREQALLAAYGPKLPAGVRLLGIDGFGVDLMDAARRRRLRFAGEVREDAALESAVDTLLSALAADE